jgi:TetR/AcrR family transcriptional regulator, transcriptional repressor for nem operon
MRYPAEHKSQVRERIVQSASRRFRRRGSEDVAIADLMRDLKLTHGGFYRHFRGKEHLFNEAFVAAAVDTRSRLRAIAEQAPAGRALEAIIDTYLSVRHCANVENGCPLAALATEMCGHPKTTRATLDRAIRDQGAEFARFMPGDTLAEREQTAVILFAGMAGTLILARATADETLRRQILEAARSFYGQLVRGRS